MLKGTCIVAQSGGPSAVINSSICGAIETAHKTDCITKVYGALNGIQGVLDDRLCDMSKEDPREIRLLKTTPSSALGSCRVKLPKYTEDDSKYKRILDIFKKYDVRYFFYNGGNDSMDTCMKVSAYMQSVGYDCRIMGIPKTIDNDLALTDHCPGFASAAKYIATSIMEVRRDCSVYPKGSVIIFEIMGRNAGWLAASASLASVNGEGPDLIYLPETVFDIDAFFEKVTRIYRETGNCIVAVSEGIKDKTGRYVSEYGSDLAKSKDAFGHAQMGGLASYLAAEAKARIEGCKVRGIELSLLQRCAAHCASETDVEEAYMAGKTAVTSAVEGNTDKMIGFERVYQDGKYTCVPKLFDLCDVANAEKTVPTAWIKADGEGMTDEFIEYALPLINGESKVEYENGLPRFARLKKVTE